MKVSIVVPVYNGEKYLKNCIDSIQNQSYRELEIIIINDGSKDNSSKIIKEIAKLDNRIIYMEQENRGVSFARNKGVELAEGEFIAFIDCDDSIEKNYIESLVRKCIDNNLDIVTCGYTDISMYGSIKLNDFYKGNFILSKDEFVNNIFKDVGGVLWGKIFRKEIIDRNYIRMNPDIFMCEDMIFVLQYAMKSNTFGAIDEVLYNYNRKNEESVSSKINFKYFNNLIEVMEEIECILNKNNYEKEFIDSILCERIKSLACSFSIMQHNKKHNYSKKEKINNIICIFENKYFKRYKDLFMFSNKNEQLLIKYIKEENISKLYYYSFCIFFANNIKKNIRKLFNNGG